MSSTFGTYSVAYSGMYVNQASLTATSSNLANADTTGASKLAVTSVERNTIQSNGKSTGTGVSVESILRSRDIYLDSQYRTTNSTATYLSVKKGDLEYIETLLNEYDVDTTDSVTTSTSGVQNAIDTFFEKWSTLSTSGTQEDSSSSARQEVLTAASDLVDMLGKIDDKLETLQTDAVTGVTDGTDKLNDLAGQIAELNDKISLAESSGGEASNLRDQRDVLLDEMSSLANINVVENNGTFKVTLNDVTLVSGKDVNKLKVEGDGSASDPLAVKWALSGDTAIIKGGSIKAYLEEADQTGYETIDTGSLPYAFSATSAKSSISTMRQALNDLVTTLAAKVNALCTSGNDLNGDTGLNLFTAVDTDKALSISNIEVNPVVAADENKVVTGTTGKDGDNTIATEIAALLETECYQSDGTSLNITEFYTAVTSWAANAGSTASKNYETKSAAATLTDNQRQAVSGISVDEEMSNMIKFQEAYAASARVMSTIDGLLGDLIQEIG